MVQCQHTFVQLKSMTIIKIQVAVEQAILNQLKHETETKWIYL